MAGAAGSVCHSLSAHLSKPAPKHRGARRGPWSMEQVHFRRRLVSPACTPDATDNAILSTSGQDRQDGARSCFACGFRELQTMRALAALPWSWGSKLSV